MLSEEQVDLIAEGIAHEQVGETVIIRGRDQGDRVEGQVDRESLAQGIEGLTVLLRKIDGTSLPGLPKDDELLAKCCRA